MTGEEVAVEGEMTTEATPQGEAEPVATEPQSVEMSTMVTQADASVEEVASVVQQLEQLREQAEENKKAGADPKGVDRLLMQAEELQKRAEDHRKLVEKAVSGEDAKTAAEEGIRLQQVVEQASALVSQARPLSEGVSAAAGPDAENAAAMAKWSERVMQGG